MRRTMRDLAAYLKEIMVPDTPGAWAVKPAFALVAPEADVRVGVRAFRAFLARLYDALAADGDAYDKHTKVAHEYENRTTLSGYYPFLHHVKGLLMNIGYKGVLAKDGAAILCGPAIFDEKLSTAKTMECLRFLAGCGLGIGGVDLHNKKPSLPDIARIEITYPDDPAMLTGLKVMAIAERELGTLDNQEVFLRCDDRVIKQDATDVLTIVRDTIRPLPDAVQAFVLQLHDRYVGQGLTCTAETKGFWIYIKYAYRRKDVWGLNASLNNGYHINAKPQKMEAYPDTIGALAPALRQTIAAGYGCGRKRPEIGHCDGGCRGLPIPLDGTILPLREDIMTWFDREVSCLKDS